MKRAVVFVDGQNLYRSAKEAFGYHYPNYDIAKLAKLICQKQGWNLVGTCFYTGIPDQTDDSFWHDFWSRKMAVMGSRGIHVYSRKLRYRNQTIKLPDGSTHTILVGQEKGIDIRLALDVVQAVLKNQCDVAVVLSQDQDLSEVADEIRNIAQETGRWIKIACAYPFSPTSKNPRGIHRTDWIKIDRTTYDQCIDPIDYRKPITGKQ